VSAANATVTVSEGQTAQNIGTVSDPNGDTVTLTASVGNVVNNGNGTWSWNWTTTDGPANSQAVTISGADGQGGSAQATFNLVVNNVAPTASFDSTPVTILTGQSVALTFTNMADVNADVTAGLLYSYDCTNNGSFELFLSGSPTFNCSYTVAGAFTAIARIQDKDGGFTDYSKSVTVQAPAASATPTPTNTPTNTPVPADVCFADTTVADFTSGTVGTGAFISQPGDGTLTLSPALEEAFNGSSLPGGWNAPAWAAGGSGTVNGGSLILDGARAGTNATYSPLRSIEFQATFTNTAWQHIGLVADFQFLYDWAIFSTFSGDGNLYARTINGENTPLGSSAIGSSHRYRIEVFSNSTRFYIDGALVATHGSFLTGYELRPMASDDVLGGPPLTMDWVRLSPNAASGVFTSRVFDATESRSWDEVNWNSLVPANTTLSVRVRSGQTATPDGSWNAWAAVTSGSNVGQVGRYVQYEVTLGTSDSGVTPMLYDISFECSDTGSQPNGFSTDSTPDAPTEEASEGRITPTVEPSLTPLPTDEPTAAPTETLVPSETPTDIPTATLVPTEPPTATPLPTETPVPTDLPTEEPTVEEPVAEETPAE
jgi:hypothetical protein